MIELKITNSAALLLLIERMKIELEFQKQNKKIPEGSTFETMNYAQLTKLIDYAAFDLICMLPPEVLSDKNNIPEIITKAINSLSGIFHKDELRAYSLTQAKNLIRPIELLLEKYLAENLYLLN